VCERERWLWVCGIERSGRTGKIKPKKGICDSDYGRVTMGLQSRDAKDERNKKCV